MCIMIVTEILVQSLVLFHYLPTSTPPWHILVQGNEWPVLIEKKALREFFNPDYPGLLNPWEHPESYSVKPLEPPFYRVTFSALWTLVLQELNSDTFSGAFTVDLSKTSQSSDSPSPDRNATFLPWPYIYKNRIAYIYIEVVLRRHKRPTSYIQNMHKIKMAPEWRRLWHIWGDLWHAQRKWL